MRLTALTISFSSASHAFSVLSSSARTSTSRAAFAASASALAAASSSSTGLSSDTSTGSDALRSSSCWSSQSCWRAAERRANSRSIFANRSAPSFESERVGESSLGGWVTAAAAAESDGASACAASTAFAFQCATSCCRVEMIAWYLET